MKKISLLFIALILVLALSACGSFGKPDITRERALEIALEKAGVKESDIWDLDIELDTEFGRAVWEIDFEHENSEYSYDVNAKTGDVTRSSRERDN